MTKDQYLGFQRGPRPEQSDQRQPDQAASFSHKAEALRDSASVASRIRFPTGTPDALRCAPRDKIRLDASERSLVVALLFLLLPTSLFWATYEQQGNTIALWASDFTDRSITLIFWRG